MDRFTNAIKRHAAIMDAGGPQPRWGIIQSVNPARPCAKVLLQPEGVLTGWLPIVQTLAGGGYSLLSLPLPGDMAFCVPEGGGTSDYVIVGTAHNDGSQPPQPSNKNGTGGVQSTSKVQVVPGEVAIVSKSGAVIRICADGSIYMRPASGIVNMDATLHVNGDVFDRHGSLDRLRGNYDTHTHPQNPDSAGNTEQPTGTTTKPDAE